MRAAIVLLLAVAGTAIAGPDQPWRDPSDGGRGGALWVVAFYLAAFVAFALVAERNQWVLPVGAIGLFVVLPMVSCMG